MFYEKKQLLLVCLGAMAGGALLHFVHDWFPSPLTALFAPVNESLWEHVKIILWPYLAGAALLTRGRPTAIRPWLLVLPLLCAVMLAFGWFTHITLELDAMWPDIVLFAALMAVGFWLPTRFDPPFYGPVWILPLAASGLLVLLTFLFTFRPPDLLLFRELSPVSAYLLRYL